MATSNRIQSNMNTVAFSCFATPATAIQLLRDEILANNKNAKLSPESFSAEEKALVNEIMHASATQQTDDERVIQGEKLLHDLIFGIMDGIIPTLQAHQQLKKDNRRRQVGYQSDKLSQTIIALVNIADYAPANDRFKLFQQICKSLEKIQARGALKFCSILFRHQYEIEDKSSLVPIYKIWLRVAGVSGCLDEVPHTIDELREFILKWQLTGEPEEAYIWQALFEQLAVLSQKPKVALATNISANKQQIVDLTNKVMLEMLKAANVVLPEPEEKAKIAKQCILHSLRDKQTYLYDSLLSNPIMEHVKNTPDYELLEIFTKGMLSDYRRFTQSSHGQTFLSEIHRNAGVDPSPFLERKIRQLTFIELAAQCLESKRNGKVSEASLSLSKLRDDLELRDDIAVEEFVIDAIRTNMVRAKLSQRDQKVCVHHAVPRQFTRAHWEELSARLAVWKEQIGQINQGFNTIINEVAPRVFENSFAGAH